jgi:hypothetical protein
LAEVERTGSAAMYGDGGAVSSKAASLQKEIDAFKVQSARSNRKLARDIASWVETAMSSKGSGPSAGAAGAGAGAGAAGRDNENDSEIPAEDKEEEDLIEQATGSKGEGRGKGRPSV